MCKCGGRQLHTHGAAKEKGRSLPGKQEIVRWEEMVEEKDNRSQTEA